MKREFQSPYPPAECFSRLESAAARGIVISPTSKGLNRLWVLDANLRAGRASFALSEPGVGNLFQRSIHVRVAEEGTGSLVALRASMAFRAWILVVPWVLLLSFMALSAWLSLAGASDPSAVGEAWAKLAMALGLFILSAGLAAFGFYRSRTQERVVLGLIRQTLRANPKGSA